MNATAYVHASGDVEGCCAACLNDGGFESEDEGTVICRDPRPDPDAPGLCAHCSHTVEGTRA